MGKGASWSHFCDRREFWGGGILKQRVFLINSDYLGGWGGLRIQGNSDVGGGQTSYDWKFPIGMLFGIHCAWKFPIGVFLGSCTLHVGAMRAHLGASSLHLSDFWAPLGHILAPFRLQLGSFWVPSRLVFFPAWLSLAATGLREPISAHLLCNFAPSRLHLRREHNPPSGDL